MTKKQPRVPEMHDTKPNREQRRHPDGLSEDQPLARDDLAPPTPDPAPKHGHKKPTAEKWSD